MKGYVVFKGEIITELRKFIDGIRNQEPLGQYQPMMAQTPLSEKDSTLDKYGPFNSPKGIFIALRKCVLNRTVVSGERCGPWTSSYGYLVTSSCNASVAERGVVEPSLSILTNLVCCCQNSNTRPSDI